MTRAAYREAIDWSAASGIELGLECDVHFSADDQLICLHDLKVDRTATSTGYAFGLDGGRVEAARLRVTAPATSDRRTA